MLDSLKIAKKEKDAFDPYYSKSPNTSRRRNK
jgi:hypothetical protein